MNIVEIIAQDVFDKVRSRFSNLEMGDENGTVTTDPRTARFFDFDFAVEGNTLGRVSISINELGTLKLFYGQGITEGVDPITTSMWYDFLKEMRYFAKRRMLRFDTRDITKGNLNKSDFQYLAQNGTKESNMSESAMYGSKKTSYRKLENTLLRIRHSKPVDETARGARSRNINALFIENEAGERFKYPFNHLAGAKAMQRHVANGGRPYDDAGQAIINMSEQIAKLVEFKRHVAHHDGMNQEVNEIIGRSQSKLDELRKTVENLSKQGYYEAWVENLQPMSDEGLVMDQATYEDYKSKFTVKSFKEDLAEYFPLIHKIMQETSEIDLEEYVDSDVESHDLAVEESDKSDDFTSFEEWAEAVADPISATMEQTGGFKEGDQVIYMNKPATVVGQEGDTIFVKVEGHPGTMGVPSSQIKPASAGSAQFKRGDIVMYKGQKVTYIRPYGDGKESYVTFPTGADDLVPTAELQPAQEAMENEEPNEQKVSMKEIAEVVKSFYDKETGKFPKGETGVITHIKKQFGEKAGQVAERFVEQLSQSSASHNVSENSDDERQDKLYNAVGALFGPSIWDNDDMFKLVQDLEDASPSDQDLDYIIAKKALPNHLSNIKFTSNDQLQFGEQMQAVPELEDIKRLSGLVK